MDICFEKIVSLDTSEAEALVGVRDVLKYNDPDITEERGVGVDTGAAYSILALPGTSDFHQHPMGVAVVTDSEELCDRALRLIKIEWEEQPFILEMEESAKPNAPRILPEAEVTRFGFGQSSSGSNVVRTEEREIGSVEKGFAEADQILEYTIKRSMNSPAGVEGMACVAQWNNDYLDLWVHHQANPQGHLSSQGMGMGGSNVVCVNDIGHLFNRQGAEAQQYGGAVMGIGRSATEEKIYCSKTGVGLNLDHINYHLGTMNDYPTVECFLNESRLGYSPYGAFGIGENIGASMSAITSSAIYNATGKWILDYPITPDKVLKALDAI